MTQESERRHWTLVLFRSVSERLAHAEVEIGAQFAPGHIEPRVHAAFRYDEVSQAHAAGGQPEGIPRVGVSSSFSFSSLDRGQNRA